VLWGTILAVTYHGSDFQNGEHYILLHKFAMEFHNELSDRQVLKKGFAPDSFLGSQISYAFDINVCSYFIILLCVFGVFLSKDMLTSFQSYYTGGEVWNPYVVL
jgi:hypothetical protein